MDIGFSEQLYKWTSFSLHLQQLQNALYTWISSCRNKLITWDVSLENCISQNSKKKYWIDVKILTPLEYLVLYISLSKVLMRASFHLLRQSKNISFSLWFSVFCSLLSSIDMIGVNPESSLDICSSKSSWSLDSSSSLSSLPGTLFSLISKLSLSEYHNFNRDGYLIWLCASLTTGWKWGSTSFIALETPLAWGSVRQHFMNILLTSNSCGQHKVSKSQMLVINQSQAINPTAQLLLSSILIEIGV